LHTGAKVLVEKPLATDPRVAEELAVLGSDRLCVGYNLRFHAPVQHTIAAIQDGSIGRLSSLRLWFGSWLPDWRPATDYRASYSAQRALGGGVLLDAIHELDLLLWILPNAELEVVGAVVAQVGPLEIDVEDTVHAILRSGDGRVVIDISLDYLARRYRRGIEATGEVATVRLDWARQVIEVETAEGIEALPAGTPIGRSYEQQDAAFLAWLAGGPALPVDGTAGTASVALAEAIRTAAR
jgi:predicted dehydrogenase